MARRTVLQYLKFLINSRFNFLKENNNYLDRVASLISNHNPNSFNTLTKKNPFFFNGTPVIISKIPLNCHLNRLVFSYQH